MCMHPLYAPSQTATASFEVLKLPAPIVTRVGNSIVIENTAGPQHGECKILFATGIVKVSVSSMLRSSAHHCVVRRRTREHCVWGGVRACACVLPCRAGRLKLHIFADTYAYAHIHLHTHMYRNAYARTYARARA